MAHEFLDFSEDSTGQASSQVSTLERGFPPVLSDPSPGSDIIRVRCLAGEIAPSSYSSVLADPECPGGSCTLCRSGTYAFDRALYLSPITHESADSKCLKHGFSPSSILPESGDFEGVDCLTLKTGIPSWEIIESLRESACPGCRADAKRWFRVRYRSRLFYRRTTLGIAIALALGQRVRWLEVGFSTDLHNDPKVLKIMHRFLSYLRAVYPGSEFIYVWQRHGLKPRSDGTYGFHCHIMWRGEQKIDVLRGNAWLRKHCGDDPVTGESRSHISGCQELRSGQDATRYMAKTYLQDQEKFVQFRESQGWGGPRGNRGYVERRKRLDGRYPEQSELVALAVLPREQGIQVIQEFKRVHPAPGVSPELKAEISQIRSEVGSCSAEVLKAWIRSAIHRTGAYESSMGYGSRESISGAVAFARYVKRQERLVEESVWESVHREWDHREVLRCMRSNFESVRCVEECPPFTFGLRL